MDGTEVIDNAPEAVDQQGIVNDFTEQFIDQDAEPVAPAPEQPAVEDKPKPEPAKEAATQTQTVNTEKKEPSTLKPYSDEKGNFSPDKWAEYDQKIRSSLKPMQKYQANIDASAQEAPAQTEPPKPIHVRVREEAQQHISSIEAHVVKPIERLYGMIQAGQDPIAAIQQIYQEQKSLVQNEAEDFRERRRAELEDEAYQAKNGEAEFNSMVQKASANFSEVAAEFGGADKLNELLNTHELAGDHIIAAFEEETGHKKYASVQQHADAINKWWAKKAQNPDTIRRFARIGFMQEVYNNTPKVYEYMKKSIQQSTAERKASVPGRTRTVTSAPSAPAENAMAGWFGKN